MTVALDWPSAAREAFSRLSPALFLALVIGTIAIAGYRAWWSLVFAAFAAAVALMERRTAKPAQIVGMALALGGPPALGLRATPLLGRYQRVVLVVAAVAGVVGTVANVLAFPLFIGPSGG